MSPSPVSSLPDDVGDRIEATGLTVNRLSVRIPLPGTPRRWVHAASDLTVQVSPGQVVAVVGESGCGKSVLALTAMGLLPAGTRTAGRVLVRGVDVLAAPQDRLRELRGRAIAMIPQSAVTNLTPVRSIGSQVVETLAHHGLPSAAGDVEALLVAVGLPPSAAVAYPHELSGGMAQRVLVALTLALAPDVIIADEPTSALDVDSAGLVLDALRARAAAGSAVVLITHDLVAARAVADSVAVMYAGRFVEVGPARDVLHRPVHDYTRALLDALPENGLRPPPGTPSSLVDPPAGVCAWHTRVGRQCPSTPLRRHAACHLVACLEPT